MITGKTYTDGNMGMYGLRDDVLWLPITNIPPETESVTRVSAISSIAIAVVKNRRTGVESTYELESDGKCLNLASFPLKMTRTENFKL